MLWPGWSPPRRFHDYRIWGNIRVILGSMGIMEKKMETTISVLGFRVYIVGEGLDFGGGALGSHH